MKFLDRLLTILVTATLTSAFWIVAGGSLIDNANSESQIETTRPAQAEPSPTEAAIASPGDRSLDTRYVTQPKTVQVGELMVPVLNIRPTELTDTYSDSRGGGERLHEAIDIMAPTGTSVVAAAPGKIEKLFRSDAGGNTIYIRSTDGETIFYYAHLDEYAEGLKEGQSIRRGQRLGTVGSSGNASPDAPHLHFAVMQTRPESEWWEPANAVNPYPLLTRK